MRMKFGKRKTENGKRGKKEKEKGERVEEFEVEEKVEKKKEKKTEDPNTWSTKLPPLSRLSGKEKIAFFKYLAVMTESGLPLEKGLLALHAQARSQLMHRILHRMLTDVTSGEFLSTSLRKMPHIFDSMLVSLVEVGENSGTLTETLFRISEHLEKSRALVGKVRGALLYPIIVVCATGGITAYLLFVLLPQLTPLFKTLKVDIPWTTRVVVWVSEFAIANAIWIGLGLVLFIIGFALLMRLRPFRYAVHLVLLKLPIFGPLNRKVQITQFSRVVGTLVKSGITVVEAFQIASRSLSNLVYQKSLASIASELQGGESISSYLERHRALFPPFITQMITMGEETGKLDESFLFISTFSEREVDDTTKTLTTVLEPLLMLLIGGLVGFIAIAIITPIYSLTSGIRR